MGMLRWLVPLTHIPNEIHYIVDDEFWTEIPYEYKQMGVDEGWLELIHYNRVGDTVEWLYRMV